MTDVTSGDSPVTKPDGGVKDPALTLLAAECTAIKGKVDLVLEKIQSVPAPALDVRKELTDIQTKLDGIAAKSPAADVSIWLKALGAVLLAFGTGWWSAYLTGHFIGVKKIREKMAEHSVESYLQASRLVDLIGTDLEGFCLDTRQDTKEADGHAATLRALIDTGPFPERVTSSLRAFNNYVQDKMALNIGKEMSPEEKAAIRLEARRLSVAAAAALRSWAGQ